MSTPNQLSFFDLANRYEALSQQGDPLERLAHHIPWERFRKSLEKNLRRSKREQGGRPPFDAVLMFKVLVLQALYNLSDDQTEYQIRDRLSFMRFLVLICISGFPMLKPSGSFERPSRKPGLSSNSFSNLIAIWHSTGYKPVGAK